MLTLFQDNGHLTRRQRRNNSVHSSTRMIVERSLSLYKARFRKAKINGGGQDGDAPVKIVATCVLHKICIIADEDEGGAPPYADADNQRNGIMINLL